MPQHASKDRMRLLLTVLTVLTAACGSPTLEPLTLGPANSTYMLVNGNWYNGTAFEARTMYVENGRLRTTAPLRIDSTLDLAGGFVVPAFGESHQHNLEDNGRTDVLITEYLHAGVMYVLNPNVLPESRDAVRSRLNQPGSPAVAFATGGLTGPGGHPAGVAQRNIDRGVWTAAQGDGGFYFTIADTTDLNAVWPRLMAQQPDIIKTYLLYSEEFDRRRADRQFQFWRGLDPSLLPAIVTRARAAGLRVVTHVETRADFRAAVEAGVDGIAHLPGFRQDGPAPLTSADVTLRLTSDDAARAAQVGVFVSTTILGASGSAIVRANLRLLADHGVRIAVGTDSYEETTLDEVRALRRNGGLSDAEILRALAVVAPRTVYPNRLIGALDDGYEASLLVLDADPTADVRAVERIQLRMQDGRLLRAP